jgi:hypothetical protein
VWCNGFAIRKKIKDMMYKNENQGIANPQGRGTAWQELTENQNIKQRAI